MASELLLVCLLGVIIGLCIGYGHAAICIGLHSNSQKENSED